MITNDEITVDATKYPYERKYSTSNEHFWDTFPWQEFFPDMIQIPWHFQVFHVFQISGHPVSKRILPGWQASSVAKRTYHRSYRYNLMLVVELHTDMRI